jgi:aryl-alcohol dehydrogenase-like predicted oxidoreductase
MPSYKPGSQRACTDIVIGVRRIGLGCNPFGRDRDGRDVDAIVGSALNGGIKLFDTAPTYRGKHGLSEVLLGRALAGVARDRFEVATKVGLDADNTGRIVPVVAITPSSLELRVRQSLRALGVGHIDLLFLHTWHPERDIESWCDAFAHVVRLGMVDRVGLSRHPPEAVLRYVEAGRSMGLEIATHQFEHALSVRSRSSATVAQARELGMTSIAFGVLAGGLLTGKYARGGTGRLTSEQYRAVLDVGGRNHGHDLLSLAHEWGATPAALAIAWALADPGVDVALVGITHPAQLRDVDIALTLDLSKEECRQIEGVVVARAEFSSLPIELERLSRASG